MKIVDQTHTPGLGHLCASDDAIVVGAPIPGMERIEVCMTRQTYAPHRHEAYALGVTLGGIQTFSYRGEKRISVPGNILAIHPDEKHDGKAGDERRLYYRMLYLDPALLSEALLRKINYLPFITNPIIQDNRLRATLLRALGPLNESLDSLLITEIIGDIAEGLCQHTHEPEIILKNIATRQIRMACDYLNENYLDNITSNQLETVTGLSRFALFRHFRALYAVSPHKYLITRRLQHARRLIESGLPLAKIAYEVGFSDQSHLNRSFKNTLGVTPGQWASLVGIKGGAGSSQAVEDN